MKTRILKRALILTATVLLVSGFNNARGEEFQKFIERKYDVDKNATLAIINKFGDVHCQVWGDNVVSIKVEITVEASSQEKADKVFDRISVEISGDRNKVSGVTQVGNMSFGNVEFSIDYYIMMPITLNIDMNHSFGELFIEETNGSARINLEYGEMEIQALNGLNSDITLKFSEGSVDYLKGGKVNIEYGEFQCEGTNDLEIRSRFSEVNIDKMEALILDSQYDDISLESTGKVNVISRFSDVEVDDLNGNFVFDCQYDNVDVDYIHAGFSEGRILASFSGISLTFDPAASFKVSAVMKFCSLIYPSSNSSVSHTEENYVTNMYKGVIGSNRSTTASLVIESQNGDVEISY